MHYNTIGVIMLTILNLLIVRHELTVLDVLKEIVGGLTVQYLL